MMGWQGGLSQDTPSLLWPCSTCPSLLWENTVRLITSQFPDPQSTGFEKLKVIWFLTWMGGGSSAGLGSPRVELKD